MVTGQPKNILVYTNHKNDIWRTKEEELKDAHCKMCLTYKQK